MTRPAGRKPVRVGVYALEPPELGKRLQESCKARARNAACTTLLRRLFMRKSFVLALAMAASFSVSAQQADAPGKRLEGNPQQDRAPQVNQQAPASEAEQERIRVEGAAGGPRPGPREKGRGVGAGAVPHRHDRNPSPATLPKDEPVQPA